MTIKFKIFIRIQIKKIREIQPKAKSKKFAVKF